jgi:uncharacterized protein YbaP (TraB family)
MRHATAVFVLATLLGGGIGLRAQQAEAPPEAQPIQEVVVEGQHEGPRMWKVHKGDHTLWILGTISPLPKKMIWKPDAVREVLQQTQEVIPAWPTYGIGANPITAVRVFIEWRRLQKPPDNLPLRETLPPALYARVESLKNRYDPKNKKIEGMRPMLAARELLTKVFDAAGLAVRNEVQQSVLDLARAQDVRVHQDKIKIEDPVDVLKDVGATPLDREVACLDSVSTSERVRTLIARAQDNWMIAVEDSLSRNRGTLAVQSMDRLLGEHGVLAALRARGYTVEGP